MARKKVNPLSELTYNKAIYGLTSGALVPEEIWKDFRNLRDNYMRNIRNIQQSSVPFRRSENVPSIPTVGELKRGSLEDIAHAIADINLSRKSWGTVTQRKETQRKQLASLQKNLPWLDSQGMNTFGDFMEWFRENQVNKLFGSQDDRVEDFLEERVKSGKKMPASQRSWGRIYIKWLRENGFEEEAERVRSQVYPSAR